MIKPHFTFQGYTNFFKVHVDNLEQLSVDQIKKILDFVQKRRGFFDFETYEFKIQKKMDFKEFKVLCEDAKLEVVLKEFEGKQQLHKNIQNENVQTDTKIDFGKYKGKFFKELPDSYIIWLRRNYVGKFKDIIVQEYKKRALN